MTDSDAPITPLARPVSTRLRSALIIPTLPQILNELVQNALDAGCTRVDCYIDLSAGNESMRVEDDGHGLDSEALKHVGVRYASSKERADAALTPITGYGFRGEALSSIAALGQLEITTKTSASRHSYTKVLRASKVVAKGRSNRGITGTNGTTVIVKDIFHQIPVRQASLASTPASTTLAGCKRVVETLALVHPDVKWSLWEERYAGTSTMNEPKRILAINPGKTSADVFRNVYGSALVERVQNIRVSAGTKRMDGFISLQGSLSRSNQHLYINKFPIERSELHAAISKRFAHSCFSYMTQDDVESTSIERDRRRSPRRLERHPIYVLNITIPPDEIDASYTPKKDVLGYKDESSVQAFVLAVVDEFLRRHGFATDKRSIDTAAPASPAPSPSRSTRTVKATPARSTAASAGLLTQHFGQSVDRSMPPPSTGPRKDGLVRGEPQTPQGRLPSRNLHEGSISSRQEPKRKRQTWLEELQATIDTGVLPVTPDQIRSFLSTPIPFASIACSSRRHRCTHSIDTPHVPSTDVKFTPDALKLATIIGQVDKKFIACLVDTGINAEQSLILIDQHAADERVAVEVILHELCDGFATDSVKQTALQNTQIVLTRHEAELLSDPAILNVFARWGIALEPPSFTSKSPSVGSYVQVAVKAVPTILAYRLARKETTELTRLVRHYLTSLPSILGEIHAARKGNDDWQMVQRWMPKEMLELANSKACRNAIMFEDTLNRDQCRRLVNRLAGTRSPWICAHGRPSLVPLGTVPIHAEVDRKRRKIDWASWADES